MRRALLSMALLGLSSTVFATTPTELPPHLEAPLGKILSNFDATLAASGKYVLARRQALVGAVEEVAAAFHQLRRQSFYQLPVPNRECPTAYMALGRWQGVLDSGTADLLLLEKLRSDGAPVGLGVAPEKNAAALQRYEAFAALTTGPINVRVGQRLKEIVEALERIYYPETYRADRHATLPYEQVVLRLYSMILLTDFVFLENREAVRLAAEAK